MQRLLLVFSVLAFAGCAVGSTPAADDFTVDSSSNTPDSGDPGVKLPPSQTHTDDDLDGGTDSGTKPKDSGSSGGPCSFSGNLVTFDLSGLSGNATQANTMTTATGVTATAIVRNGLTAASASGGLNASGWPTGGLDGSKYFSFTLKSAGCALTADSVSVTLQASGSGPSNASIATSADGYGSKKTASTSATANVTVNASANAGDTLEIRIYGYNAQSTGGTMRVDNAVTVSGSLH